jgi:hypothetical protein
MKKNQPLKIIDLPLSKFLKKMQYLEDEGFTLIQTNPADLGIVAVEAFEQYNLPTEEINELIQNNRKLLAASYRGKTKFFVEGINELVDKKSLL